MSTFDQIKMKEKVVKVLNVVACFYDSGHSLGATEFEIIRSVQRYADMINPILEIYKLKLIKNGGNWEVISL